MCHRTVIFADAHISFRYESKPSRGHKKQISYSIYFVSYRVLEYFDREKWLYTESNS